MQQKKNRCHLGCVHTAHKRKATHTTASKFSLFSTNPILTNNFSTRTLIKSNKKKLWVFISKIYNLHFITVTESVLIIAIISKDNLQSISNDAIRKISTVFPFVKIVCLDDLIILSVNRNWFLFVFRVQDPFRFKKENILNLLWNCVRKIWSQCKTYFTSSDSNIISINITVISLP